MQACKKFVTKDSVDGNKLLVCLLVESKAACECMQEDAIEPQIV